MRQNHNILTVKHNKIITLFYTPLSKLIVYLGVAELQTRMKTYICFPLSHFNVSM